MDAKGAHAGGKAHEGNGARGGPNFERFGGQAGHRGQGDNHVSDGSRTYDKSAHFRLQYRKIKMPRERFIHKRFAAEVSINY